MRDEAPSGDETPSVSEVASAYVDGEVGADQAAWIEANRGTDAGVDDAAPRSSISAQSARSRSVGVASGEAVVAVTGAR